MTKQEEIREGIESVIQGFEDNSPDAGYGYEKEDMALAIVSELHSQGVVIKVGRELPESIMDAVNGNDKFGKREFARLLMNWAGYEAVEPLIGADNVQ